MISTTCALASRPRQARRQRRAAATETAGRAAILVRTDKTRACRRRPRRAAASLSVPMPWSHIPSTLLPGEVLIDGECKTNYGWSYCTSQCGRHGATEARAAGRPRAFCRSHRPHPSLQLHLCRRSTARERLPSLATSSTSLAMARLGSVRRARRRRAAALIALPESHPDT